MKHCPSGLFQTFGPNDPEGHTQTEAAPDLVRILLLGTKNQICSTHLVSLLDIEPKPPISWLARKLKRMATLGGKGIDLQHRRNQTLSTAESTIQKNNGKVVGDLEIWPEILMAKLWQKAYLGADSMVESMGANQASGT